MKPSARICVTGGAGFIGSHVVRRLLGLGHEVLLYDSFLHYVHPLDRRHFANVESRLEGIAARTEVVRGSTRDLDLLTRTFQRFRPTHIVHLAAMPLAKLAQEHPEEALEAIVHGTMNTLRALRDIEGFTRLVYVSSSMIYGDFKQVPAPEDHPADPKDVYGALKLSGEITTRAFARRYGIEHAVVRPSAVYGPTDNNRRVLAAFLENALAGRTIEVNGASTALDFTYVSDAADGIVLATLHPAGRNQTFNITNGHGRTLKEAAEIIAALVPGCRIRYGEADATAPVRGTLDIERARRLLGYEPKVSLEDGLKAYLAFLRTQENPVSAQPNQAKPA